MKKMLKALPLLLFATMMIGCAKSPQTGDAMVPATDQTEENAMEVQDEFGAAFTPNEVFASSELLSHYEAGALEDTIRTTLRGEVNKVCQAKGCWMTIAAGGEEEMMVKFKDYGFFMPKDISGREVVMDGIAFYQVTSVEELRHYAEDAGKSAEEIAMITEPKRELHFLADGVKLLRN